MGTLWIAKDATLVTVVQKHPTDVRILCASSYVSMDSRRTRPGVVYASAWRGSTMTTLLSPWSFPVLTFSAVILASMDMLSITKDAPLVAADQIKRRNARFQSVSSSAVKAIRWTLMDADCASVIPWMTIRRSPTSSF